jgi:osmotically-inducible protein OsmY
MPRTRRGAGSDSRRLAVSADCEITARVRRALTADSGLRGRCIHISTLQRYVRLLGRVLSASERERAVRAALAVDGVRQVINQLAVR